MTMLGTIAMTAMNQVTMAVTTGWQQSNAASTAGVQQMTSTTQTGMQAMVAAVQAAMAAFVAAVTSGGASAVAACHSTAASMVAAFAGLAGSMSAAGANAMAGLRNGIASAGAAAVAQARSIANQVASAVNSALKIHSPSRVLMKSGHFAGEGLAEGLQQEQQNVAQAASRSLAAPILQLRRHADRQLRSAAAHGVRQSRDTVGTYRSGAIGETIDNSTNNNSQNSTVYNQTGPAPVINFSPQVTINGNATAEDVREGIKMSQRDFEKMMDQYLRGKARVSFV